MNPTWNWRRIMLAERGHLQCNLQVARGANEALARLRDGRARGDAVDLMLLDINMPGIDGFELLEQMQQENHLEHVAVIMYSTSSYDKDMEKARQLGASGYLTKPADFERFKRMVSALPSMRLERSGETYNLLRAH